MKNRKKQIVCLVLLIFILTAISACGNSEEKQNSTGEETASSVDTEPEEQSAAVLPENLAATTAEDGAGSEAGEQTTETALPEVEAGDTAPAGTNATGTTSAAAIPAVTENPTDESLTEGYSCMYIASADHADSRSWRAVSPDGEIDIPYSEIGTYFPYLEVTGEKQDALSLFNIPADFDGWGSYCRFENSAGSADSRTAVTHVKALPAAEESSREPGAEKTEDTADGKDDI